MLKRKTVAHILLYGVALALLSWLLQFLEFRFLIIRHGFEVYAGLIALIFTGLGIWVATTLLKSRVRTVVVEKLVAPASRASEAFEPDRAWLGRTGLSGRELEVLGLMANGLSNKEIAEKLFLSMNTVKTHTSRVFEKLEVSRRTQAVDKARRMGLLP